MSIKANPNVLKHIQDAVMTAIEEDDYLGFCLKCGHEHSGVEPDAEGYKCESCGELAVMGAENILIRYY
jgi:hypothetical protein